MAPRARIAVAPHAQAPFDLAFARSVSRQFAPAASGGVPQAGTASAVGVPHDGTSSPSGVPHRGAAGHRSPRSGGEPHAGFAGEGSSEPSAVMERRSHRAAGAGNGITAESAPSDAEPRRHPAARAGVFTRSTASEVAIHTANVAAPASNARRDRSHRRSPVRAYARVSARPPTALARPHTRLTRGEEFLPATGVRWVCPATAEARCGALLATSRPPTKAPTRGIGAMRGLLTRSGRAERLDAVEGVP